MKIGMLITARLKSTRLPLKLLHFIRGKRVIDHVIERCKAVSSIDEVILCTSPNPQDAPLAKAAFDQNIYYFVGDPDDVLQRLYDAATFFRLDYILSITADDPFFSIEFANRFADEALRRKPDYMYVEGLPIGAGIYGIRYEALKTVINFKNRKDTEIWGYWFNHPELFDVHVFHAQPKEHRNVRLTLDTYEDLAFLQRLGHSLADFETLSYHALLRAIDQLPLDAFVNNEIVQLRPSDEVINDIGTLYREQREQFWKMKEENYKK